MIHGKWHVWKGQASWLVSDEETKRLRYFATIDDAINWLWFEDRDAARALNTYKAQHNH